MAETKGVIYILTNPSFPEYVKIGYADDVERRLTELNRSECIPYAFRIYATYEVPKRLSDLSLHRIIDKLNPNLRTIDTFNGKPRKKEFYAMSKEEAYFLLESIAEIHDCTDKLKIWDRKLEEIHDETMAEVVKTENDYDQSELLDNENNLSNQELYSLLHNYLQEKNDRNILKYNDYYNSETALYFESNYLNSVFPEVNSNKGWHKTGKCAYYLIEIREKLVNLQVIWAHGVLGRTITYQKAVEYSQNVGIRVVKDNPRFAGYFPFVVRIKRDGLNKESLYENLDNALLPLLKKEEEVYQNIII